MVLDLHLNCLDRRLPFLEDGLVLIPLLRCPDLSPQVGVDHFTVLKKIGAGGFSTVYLSIPIVIVRKSQKEGYGPTLRD